MLPLIVALFTFHDYIIQVNLCYNYGWGVSLETFVSFITFKLYMLTCFGGKRSS